MLSTDSTTTPWTLDGFKSSDALPSPEFDRVAAQPLYLAIERLSRLLRVRVEGIQRIPAGRALLVGNHAFGWDALFIMSRIWHEQSRPVWVLGDHVFWRIPYLRRIARTLGTVDGSVANLNYLLSRDQLVLVLPGGIREALKPRQLRYRLLWGQRYGFVRSAIRHATPIVPVASIGADELFDFVGDAYARGRRWLRRPNIPIPLPTRLLPIPHLVPLRFVIGEPIPPPVGPAHEHDALALRRFRWQIAGALHELIDNELARRTGIDLS